MTLASWPAMKAMAKSVITTEISFCRYVFFSCEALVIGPLPYGLPHYVLLRKEGVRSKFSANDSREKHAAPPKIGPDPDFFNGLLTVRVHAVVRIVSVSQYREVSPSRFLPFLLSIIVWCGRPPNLCNPCGWHTARAFPPAGDHYIPNPTAVNPAREACGHTDNCASNTRMSGV